MSEASAAAKSSSTKLANGAVLTFSREDEREADRVGATIMRQAG